MIYDKRFIDHVNNLAIRLVKYLVDRARACSEAAEMTMVAASCKCFFFFFQARRDIDKEKQI